jgi:predicted Zn-dependent peptidase
VQELGLFSEINAYITGDLGPGLFVVSGKLCDGIDFSKAEEAIDTELERLRQEPVPAEEIEKVANKYENTFLFSQYKASDRALSLCYYEMIGQPDLVNNEPANYRRVSPDCIAHVAGNLTAERCSTLYIQREKDPQL